MSGLPAEDLHDSVALFASETETASKDSICESKNNEMIATTVAAIIAEMFATMVARVFTT